MSVQGDEEPVPEDPNDLTELLLVRTGDERHTHGRERRA